MVLLHRKEHEVAYKERVLEKTSGYWPTLVNDIGAVTLFGKGFGPFLQPDPSCSPHYQTHHHHNQAWLDGSSHWLSQGSVQAAW
jgi:hypothetical protein